MITQMHFLLKSEHIKPYHLREYLGFVMRRFFRSEPQSYKDFLLNLIIFIKSSFIKLCVIIY